MVAEEERRHRRRYLRLSEAFDGGYDLEGYLETLRGDAGAPVALLDWGFPISGKALRRIALDAEITPILPTTLRRLRWPAAPTSRPGGGQDG